MERRDFTKIRQWAASLAILSGMGIRYINALQGTCLLNIQCDILNYHISTILFFVFPRIMEFGRDLPHPFWELNPLRE
jgi:hypothetical protein